MVVHRAYRVRRLGRLDGPMLGQLEKRLVTHKLGLISAHQLPGVPTH
uniref:Uncharacterized protein n=1 Tax=Arundo donax TaxID=35708 RepID=A0A0A9GP40_ARUDO